MRLVLVWQMTLNSNLTILRINNSLEEFIRKRIFAVSDCLHNQRLIIPLNFNYNPVGNYMFKVNNRNTRTRCEICSKLTTKTPEPRYWRRSGVFIVNFEHISHLVLVFLLLTLSR